MPSLSCVQPSFLPEDPCRVRVVQVLLQEAASNYQPATQGAMILRHVSLLPCGRLAVQRGMEVTAALHICVCVLGSNQLRLLQRYSGSSSPP